MATKLTVTSHQKRLESLRDEATERLEQLTKDYDALAEVGTDVGSGDDEGGSESDGTFVERDRIRAQIAEDRKLLEEIEVALGRAASDDWKNCTSCGVCVRANDAMSSPLASSGRYLSFCSGVPSIRMPCEPMPTVVPITDRKAGEVLPSSIITRASSSMVSSSPP